MGRFKRVLFEYEDLRNGGDLEVWRGARFTEGEAKRIFKSAVQLDGSETALKYSAFYKSRKRRASVFMLGWDHAMLIEKRGGKHYVKSIYAHGDSDQNPDVCVFQVTSIKSARKLKYKSIEHIPDGSHSCGHHKKQGCAWRRYDLGDGVEIERLVTFSITSCSFACAWPVDNSHIVVSHIAFSPAIPLFWILRHRVPNPTFHTIRMLASLNNTTDELDKFTAAKLPYANLFRVDAKYLLRGPYKCRNDGVFAPFKTHPYVTLEFDGSTIKYGGALGYNNDPNMPIEMPPFHSTIGNALQAFKGAKDAKAILEAEHDLLSGRYGFTSLHHGMLARIESADNEVAKVDAKAMFFMPSKRYKSQVVDALLSQIGTRNIVVPVTVKGRERAVFMLAELSDNSKNPAYVLAFKAVMLAWDVEQLGYSMPIDLFHRGDAPAIAAQLTEEVTSDPLMDGLKRAMKSMQSNPVFKALEEDFEERQSRDWD